MSKRIRRLLTEYTQRDYDALRSVYDFRCLTFDQIFNRHYRYNEEGEEVTDGYFKKKLRKIEEDGLLKLVEGHSFEPVYFLTPDGVNFVKNAFNFPSNIYDARRHLHVKGYLTASELEVAPTFVTHQLHLNQFVLDFLDQHPEYHYSYKDEKHITNYVGIRPDGVLRMLDIDFFLEMDMGTEDSSKLREKWDNYRRFIRSNEFTMKENKIIVLFIVDGVDKENIGARKDLIKRTIFEGIVDLVDKDIEIYVDTKDHLLNIVKDRIFALERNDYHNQKLLMGLLVDYGFKGFHWTDKLSRNFDGERYDYYIRKENSKGGVLIEDGKHQDYIIEDFSYSPLSVVGKMTYFDNKRQFFYNKFRRPIDMIVLVEDENFIYNQMMLYQIVDLPNIHYTTLHRLGTRPFNEALFGYDENGRRYHYTNNALNQRVYEN